MSKTDNIIRRMLQGYASTLQLIQAGGGLTPLSRLSEWRKKHSHDSEEEGSWKYAYLYNGKRYFELTREKRIGNTRLIERKLVRVK